MSGLQMRWRSTPRRSFIMSHRPYLMTAEAITAVAYMVSARGVAKALDEDAADVTGRRPLRHRSQLRR